MAKLNRSTSPPYEYGEEPGLDPDRRLLAAILGRAIWDFLHDCVDIKRTDRSGAGRWLFSRSKENKPFSFTWVCQHLGLDAKEIKKKVKKLPRS